MLFEPFVSCSRTAQKRVSCGCAKMVMQTFIVTMIVRAQTEQDQTPIAARNDFSNNSAVVGCHPVYQYTTAGTWDGLDPGS